MADLQVFTVLGSDEMDLVVTLVYMTYIQGVLQVRVKGMHAKPTTDTFAPGNIQGINSCTKMSFENYTLVFENKFFH